MKLLGQLGTKVERNGSVWIDASNVNNFSAPYELVKTMRRPSGRLVRWWRVSVRDRFHCRADALSARPVDLHIFGWKTRREIKLEEGYVKASVNGRLKGALSWTK